MRPFRLFCLPHYDDLVIVCDRIEPVGNRDHRCILELLLDGSLNEVVSRHVHIRGRLIQHKEFVSP